MLPLPCLEMVRLQARSRRYRLGLDPSFVSGGSFEPRSRWQPRRGFSYDLEGPRTLARTRNADIPRTGGTEGDRLKRSIPYGVFRLAKVTPFSGISASKNDPLSLRL